jgi:hypothetical protein
MPLLTELENLFGFVLQRFRADGAENQVLFCRQDAGSTMAAALLQLGHFCSITKRSQIGIRA